MLYVMESIFEIEFAEHSYGFRPGRNAHQAAGRVNELLEAGYTWVVDADIKGYFENIPQDKLLARVRERIADSNVLALLEKFLRQGVMDTARGWQPTENGTPQGAVISPLLANIYLNPIDHHMAGQGREMIRYADDFVILCRTEPEAREALAELRKWMAAAGLTLHPEKTKIVEGAFEESGGRLLLLRQLFRDSRDETRAGAQLRGVHVCGQVFHSVIAQLRGTDGIQGRRIRFCNFDSSRGEREKRMYGDRDPALLSCCPRHRYQAGTRRPHGLSSSFPEK